MDYEDCQDSIVNIAWEWFYDAAKPIYDQPEFVRKLIQVPSEYNEMKVEDLSLELDNIHLDSEQLKTLRLLTKSFSIEATPNIALSTESFEKFKKSPHFRKPHDFPAIWARDREKGLKFTHDVYRCLLRHNPQLDPVETLFDLFPEPSNWRNQLLIQETGKNPLTDDPQIFESIMSDLKEGRVKDILQKRLLQAKIKSGQLSIKSLQELTILIETHFSKESQLGEELFNELLQSVPVTIAQLEHIHLERETQPETVRKSKAASTAHHILELIGDKIEDEDAKDKREFFEYLVGIRPVKPDIVLYYEYLLEADLTDASALLSNRASSEKYMFFTTLFLGEKGILNSDQDKNFLIDSLFRHATGEEPDPSNVLSVIFKELFNACDTFKQLDLLQGIFTQFTSKTSDAALLKSDMIKQVLISFGVVGIKLGQILAQQPDLIQDPALRKNLESLSDNAPAMDKRYVLSALDSEGADLARRLKEYIIQVEELLGSASVKQGYKIRLLDGQTAVLKFVRPLSHFDVGDIHSQTGNLAILKKVLESPEIRHRGLSDTLLEEINIAVRRELSISIEVQNQQGIGKFLRKRPHKDWQLSVPLISPVLVGEHFFADKFVDGIPLKQEVITQLRKTGEIASVARAVFTTVWDLILNNSSYHADLHPGNFLVDLKSKRIHLIDFGNCATLSLSNRKPLLYLLDALAKNKGKNGLSSLKKCIKKVDHNKLTKPLEDEIKTVSRSTTSLEEKLIKLTDLLEKNNLSLESEFEVLFKVLKTVSYITDVPELSAREKKDIIKGLVSKVRIFFNLR